MKGFKMKLLTLFLFSVFVVNGCGTKEKKEMPEENVPAVSEPTLPVLEVADVIFMMKGKEIAKAVIADTDSGVNATFSAEKLDKGHYVLQIEDSCATPKKVKNQLPAKETKIFLGDFATGSGNTSSDFSKPGMSVGERFLPIGQKAISLSKKNKKGSLTRISCSSLVKRPI